MQLSTRALAILFLSGCANPDWRTADRSSSGIAPLPKESQEAIAQVYCARAFRWRKYFAVHCWLASKEKNANHYTTFHVIGWRLKSARSAVVIEKDIPDRKWYGAEPFLVQGLRGAAAERAIPKIKAAVDSYPYHSQYRAWPGPNSNTFVSHILRSVPEFGVELPPHAIGKDWLKNSNLIGITESGTGGQLSIFGLLGATVGLAEGIEVNVLGMSFGIDLWRPALKLPFLGRLGFKDAPIRDPN